MKCGETDWGKARPIETHGCQYTQRLCVFKERPAAEPPLDPSKHRKVSGGHPNTQKQALGGGGGPFSYNAKN